MSITNIEPNGIFFDCPSTSYISSQTMNPSPPSHTSGLNNNGQTISWTHELDPAKLDHGWFCSCGLQCSSKGKLTSHIKSMNQMRSFSCKLCTSMTFSSANQLHRHMERYHQITHRGWVGCGDCGAVFKTRLEQSRHRASFHEDYELYCAKSNAAGPSSAGDSNNSFTCSCGKVFASKEYLNRHQRYKLKMFRCPLCDKTFGQWYNLKNHLASKHVGEYQQESFECGRCGHVFPNIEHVVAHYQAVHHGHQHLIPSTSL